jgi:hypothetical protein
MREAAPFFCAHHTSNTVEKKAPNNFPNHTTTMPLISERLPTVFEVAPVLNLLLPYAQSFYLRDMRHTVSAKRAASQEL